MGKPENSQLMAHEIVGKLGYGSNIMAGHRDTLYLGFEPRLLVMFKDANGEVMAGIQLTRRVRYRHYFFADWSMYSM